MRTYWPSRYTNAVPWSGPSDPIHETPDPANAKSTAASGCLETAAYEPRNWSLHRRSQPPAYEASTVDSWKTRAPDEPPHDRMSRSAELDAAPAPTKGTARAATPTIMTPVASQSRPRRRVGGGAAAAARWSTQRVPSQNIVRLRSATRLTRRVPWLCGPASRRVCYFVEAGRVNAVSHASMCNAPGGYSPRSV